jgi:hypothetical protein
MNEICTKRENFVYKSSNFRVCVSCLGRESSSFLYSNEEVMNDDDKQENARVCASEHSRNPATRVKSKKKHSHTHTSKRRI